MTGNFLREIRLWLKISGKGKLKHLAGVIVARKGPLTYLVRVGTNTSYCHVDHLLRAGNGLQTPNQDEDMITRQDLLPLPSTPTNPSLSVQDPIDHEDAKLTSAKPVQIIPSEAADKHKMPEVKESGPTDCPTPTPRRYPLRIRNPPKRLINEQ